MIFLFHLFIYLFFLLIVRKSSFILFVFIGHRVLRRIKGKKWTRHSCIIYYTIDMNIRKITSCRFSCLFLFSLHFLMHQWTIFLLFHPWHLHMALIQNVSSSCPNSCRCFSLIKGLCIIKQCNDTLLATEHFYCTFWCIIMYTDTFSYGIT